MRNTRPRRTAYGIRKKLPFHPFLGRTGETAYLFCQVTSLRTASLLSCGARNLFPFALPHGEENHQSPLRILSGPNVSA